MNMDNVDREFMNDLLSEAGPVEMALCMMKSFVFMHVSMYVKMHIKRGNQIRISKIGLTVIMAYMYQLKLLHNIGFD